MLLKLKLFYRNGLFGWNYRYLLTHPWEIATESYRRTKWFMQRGYRGYADCDVWGLDYYLAEWVPKALESLRKNKHGHPIGMTPKSWDTRLKRMRAGFIEARKIQDFRYKDIKDAQAAVKRMKMDLRLFSDHFLSLWD